MTDGETALLRSLELMGLFRAIYIIILNPGYGVRSSALRRGLKLQSRQEQRPRALNDLSKSTNLGSD